jgi:hypothetical protein
MLMVCSFIHVSNAADLSQNLTESNVRATDRATWIPELRLGDESAYILFYGQINKGVLFYDDGRSSQTYGLVDNDSSSTRFGVKAFARLEQEWSVLSNFEMEWEPYSTGYVNLLNEGDVDWQTHQLRKAEIVIGHPSFGSLWLGQGSMASDGTAEVDLSGTSLVGYSSVANIAGGQFYRFDGGGALSTIKVGSTFRNLDGLGRKLRVRYDAPKWHGFTLATSVGTQVEPTTTDDTVWDIAIKYDGTHGELRVKGAAALSEPGPGVEPIVDSSVSVLHMPTGISATLAGGFQSLTARDARYVYGKLGYQADLTQLGKTALSIDAYYGNEINAGGSDSVAFGAQAVQNVTSLQTDMYLGVRYYDYDDNTADYEVGIAILTGARIKF